MRGVVGIQTGSGTTTRASVMSFSDYSWLAIAIISIFRFLWSRRHGPDLANWWVVTFCMDARWLV